MKSLFLALLLFAATASAAPAAREKVWPVALPNYNVETTTRLQILLDNNDFGPGKIDGHLGEFARKALVAYKRARGLPETGAIEPGMLEQVPEAYTTFTIPPEARNFIGPVATRPEEQAKLKASLYGTLLELVAERFHSSEQYLRELNKGHDLDKLEVGDTVKVPDVLPFRIEDLKEVKLPVNPAFATRRIFVDTKERTLEVRDNDLLIAEFPITPGSQTLPAPIGTWKILGIVELPWFRHDNGVLYHGVRTSNFHNIPQGPNCPVGVLWMGLNKPGVGIHGTNNPETIGRAASHGCIRLANWDANKIKDLVSEEDMVEIY